MNDFFVYEGIKCVDTSEAIFGDFIIKGNKLLIPYFNVKIVCKNNVYLDCCFGKYIKFCILSFEEINGIVWNLNTKTNLGGKIIECYGGDYFLDKNFREFWIGYSSGSIILQIDYQTNTNPWDVSFFTNDFGRMVNNDFYKTLFL